MGFVDGGNKYCSGSAIIAIRHYKSNAFLIAENACDALTMENLTYADVMEIMKMMMCS